MVRWRRVVRRGTRVRRSPLAKYRSFGGSVWESNPSTVCLERSTGFEVREAHRVPRRFRYCKSALFKRSECTTVAREAPTVTVSPRNCHHARRQQPASRRLSGSRSRSKWRQSPKKRRGCRQRHPPRVYRVSRSALGLSVFRVYCFLADPERTVPGSLRMRRISLLLATSTPSKCASPTTLLTTVAEVVQSGFTVTVPVNVSDRIVPFALRVSWPEKFPSSSTVSTPVAAAGTARRGPLRANPHPPSRLARVHVSSSAHATRAVPNKSSIGNRRVSSFIPSPSTLQPPSPRFGSGHTRGSVPGFANQVFA